MKTRLWAVFVSSKNYFQYFLTDLQIYILLFIEGCIKIINSNRLLKNKKEQRSMEITIKDIAKELSVSTSVVSRSLSHNPDKSTTVAPETQKRVREAAIRMNYKSNRFAGSLRRGIHPVIGVFMPDFNDSLTGDFIRGLSEALDETGFYLKLYYGDMSSQYTSFLKQLDNISLSALICGIGRSLVSDENMGLMIDYKRRGGKIILQLDRDNYEKNYFKDFIYVGIDNYSGGKIVAEQFISYECKSFIIQQVMDWPTRYTGCIDNLPSKATTLMLCFDNMLTMFDARHDQLLRGYLAELSSDVSHMPIGIFIQSDRYAPHVINIIKDSGLKFKKDIFLVGYDDMFMSSYLEPALTTMHQPFYEIGRKLALKAINSIFNKDEYSEVIIPGFIRRDSA